MYQNYIRFHAITTGCPVVIATRNQWYWYVLKVSLNLRTQWRYAVSFTFRLTWLRQSQSGCFKEEKVHFPLPDFERHFLGSAVRSLATTPAELTRLFCTNVFDMMNIKHAHKPLKKHDRLNKASWLQRLIFRILKRKIPRKSEFLASCNQNEQNDVVTCVQLTWLHSRHADKTKRISSAPGCLACIWKQLEFESAVSWRKFFVFFFRYPVKFTVVSF